MAALDGVGARPAEPLLAAHLLSDQELDELIDQVCGVELGKRRETGNVLGIGVKSLDDALDGGLEDGRVVSGSFEAGAGGNEVRNPYSRVHINDNHGGIMLTRPALSNTACELFTKIRILHSRCH